MATNIASATSNEYIHDAIVPTYSTVTDFGTGESVYDYFSDGEANYYDGELASFDSRGSIIKTTKKKLVAISSVDDLVVVDTDDVLLIVPRNRLDTIKDLQNIITQQGGEKHL